MFRVTKIIVTSTKMVRKAVKAAATNKINLANASDDFRASCQDVSKVAPYSKNIFKRMKSWVKTFIIGFKNVTSEIKQDIEMKRQEMGELFTKKDRKAVIKKDLDQLSEAMKQFGDELKELLANRT